MQHMLLIALLLYSMSEGHVACGASSAEATYVTEGAVISYLMAASFPTLGVWGWHAFYLRRCKLNQQRELAGLEQRSLHVLTLANAGSSEVVAQVAAIRKIFDDHGKEAYGQHADPFQSIIPIMRDYLDDQDQQSSDQPADLFLYNQQLAQRKVYLQAIDKGLEISLKLVLVGLFSCYGSSGYTAHSISSDVMEGLDSLAQSNEEAGQPTSLIQKKFINPFRYFDSSQWKKDEQNRIERTYQKMRRKQQKCISSPLYSVMRYIIIPLGLSIGIGSLFVTNDSESRHRDSFWRAMVCMSGLLWSIAELPAYILRSRARQYNNHPETYQATMQMLSRYRLRQGFLDLGFGVGTLCFLGSRVLSDNQVVQVPGVAMTSWFALHTAHGLLHMI